jgi:hypothetical protein
LLPKNCDYYHYTTIAPADERNGQPSAAAHRMNQVINRSQKFRLISSVKSGQACGKQKSNMAHPRLVAHCRYAAAAAPTADSA